jgi:hypothetical protein
MVVMSCTCAVTSVCGECRGARLYLNISRKLRIVEMRVAINQTKVNVMRRFSVHDFVAHDNCCTAALPLFLTNDCNARV